MGLLKYDEHGEFSIINFDNSTVPPYAILSHMWGTDAEEVTYADLVTGDGRSKRGYEKIRFCGQQAQRDGLQYFWVDTCCINKTDRAELSHAIQSMFRWTVEFFSQDWERLGDKISLKSLIHKITSIQCEVLDGAHLSRFSVNERLRWKEGRVTQREEDGAYSLQGILDVELAPVYGEDPRADKKRIEGTKGGLLPDSYHWVLDNGIFQQWQRDPHSRLLWIKGDPGKGKTMLLCGIIDELKESTNDLSFCQGTDSRLNSATAVLRGLIYLLVRQQPRLTSHLRKRYDQTGGSLFQDANAWVALSEISTSMVHDEDFKTSCLVVDALDECAVDLPQLLDLIVRTAASSSCVKWLVSSRNENHIEQKLKLVGDEAKLSLELKQNVEQVARAVDAYIDHKLSCLESLEEDGLREQVRDELRRKANGTFLWVALMMQELEKPESWDPLAVVEEAPAGLPQLYNHMMDQIQRLSPRNEMQDSDKLTKLVEDAGQFVMYHKGVIESYPLQTYASALLFSPTRSVTRRLFRYDEPNGIAIRPAMSAGWSACLQTLEGHSDGVSSVAFSHDSSKLASASWDNTVKVWDASSGACLQTLEGHSHYVSSVAFSHDSSKLASALWDNTVKVWDASSGACLQTLNIGRPLYSLSFDSTSSFFYSEIGPIAIHNPGTSSEVAVVAPERSLYLGTSLSPDSI
ncbi:hypothetical protein EJ07DRAFT_177182 [Lizonia empirigonia]|nr:hypothetical protein EJ07DRAFT_177182 [Lizonia empirigonia]